MKRLLTLVAFFATIQASAQQVNPVPDYVFRNQMSVGRNAVTDTAAYFSIGPRYGATKGFMPPIVSDTASVNANKRNGLLIFSVQKNKFLYWDSVRVQWSDMAGSSGSYITGKGITGYVPQFSDTATLDTSALYTLGNQLGVGTSSFAYTGSGRTVVELNGTAGGLYGFKRNDSAKGYLFHNGDNMELANTMAGSISFNTNSATRGSIASDGVWRLHNLAGTGDRVVQASSNGTLSATASVTGLVDTLTISTRAWRQKGLDSLAALEVSGSGTTNYVAKFTAGSTIGNSQIFDNGTSIGIGTASPNASYLLEAVKNGDVIFNLRTTSATGNPYIRAQSTTTNVYSAGMAQSTGTSVPFVNDGAFNYTNGTGGMQIITGTATPIQYFTNNTERLRIFGNGRVFIGASPTDAGYQLDVNGTLRSVNGANFATTSGNVGVGTASPTDKLQIVASANNGITITTPDVATFKMRSSSGTTTNWGFATTNLAASDFGIYQSNSVGGDPINAGSPRLYFSSSGNVGIGTASPQRRLSLNVPFASTGDIGYLVSGQTGTTPLVEITSIVENVATAATAMGFVTYTANAGSATEKMRLTNNAELLINTTSDAGDYKLQVSGNIYNTGSAVLAATSGQVQVGTTAWPTSLIGKSGSRSLIGNEGIFILWNEAAVASNNFAGLYLGAKGGGTNGSTTIAGGVIKGLSESVSSNAGALVFETNGGGGNVERGRINSAGEWIIDASGTDAGDYKLQVVGNARIGTGKLDIASNTTFGLGIARSGTSEVAGQIYNSNGILYLGAESSAGGQIFTGSSAYAAVIGSGANYPLQFATNNATRATINTAGELLIATTTDNGDFKLQVNGNALISGSIKTANGGSSTAVPWHLGSVVATSVQLDTNNYVEVEINGVYYRLAIVTPL